MVPDRTASTTSVLALEPRVGYGAAMGMGRGGMLGAVVLLLLAGSLLAATDPAPSSAITLTQAEAALPLLTADPHHGPGDGVANADTEEPTQAVGGNNVVLLIAALGVLIGVLIVTRARPGSKS
jgi:hypothetical protein